MDLALLCVLVRIGAFGMFSLFGHCEGHVAIDIVYCIKASTCICDSIEGHWTL